MNMLKRYSRVFAIAALIHIFLVLFFPFIYLTAVYADPNPPMSTPEPMPTPKPMPTPQPMPTPKPMPTPQPMPTPEPMPTPKPMPTPEPNETPEAKDPNQPAETPQQQTTDPTQNNPKGWYDFSKVALYDFLKGTLDYLDSPSNLNYYKGIAAPLRGLIGLSTSSDEWAAISDLWVGADNVLTLGSMLKNPSELKKAWDAATYVFGGARGLVATDELFGRFAGLKLFSALAFKPGVMTGLTKLSIVGNGISFFYNGYELITNTYNAFTNPDPVKAKDAGWSAGLSLGSVLFDAGTIATAVGHPEFGLPLMAIGGVVYGISWVGKHRRVVGDYLAKGMRASGEVLRGASERVGDAVRSSGQVAGDVARGIGKAIGAEGLGDKVGSAVEGVTNAVGNVVEGIGDAVGSIHDKVGSWFDSWGE